MKISHIIPALSLSLLVAVSACDRSPKFKIHGDVYGAEGKTLVLSKADFAGRWIALDSVKVDGNGSFSITSAAPAAPDIYRLSLGDRFIYIPVDSVESVKVETSAKNYGSDFKLSGSENAERLTEFEHEMLGYNATDSLAAEKFKRLIYTKYIQNAQASIISYYALTKVVDGKPLFNPENTSDYRYYGAVATQYDQFRPDDPHGKMVREAALAAIRRRNQAKGRGRVLQATEISVLDIALPDENGKTRRLSEYLGKGKPVVVVFGLMNQQQSPAFNRELVSYYNSKGGNVEIFNVSVDADQYAWRDAARNLPYITVFDGGGMSSTALRDYNVQVLPSFYIYNASGELSDNAATLDELRKKL